MTLRQRAPYMAVLSMAGTFLALSALDAALARQWVDMGTDAAVAVACLAAAAALAWRRPRWQSPGWTHRFEVEGPLFRLRCNQCDAEVLPPAFTATLPRLLSYAHLHSNTACQRHREEAPGGDTARLGPPRYWRTRGRG